MSITDTTKKAVTLAGVPMFVLKSLGLLLVGYLIGQFIPIKGIHPFTAVRIDSTGVVITTVHSSPVRGDSLTHADSVLLDSLRKAQ